MPRYESTSTPAGQTAHLISAMGDDGRSSYGGGVALGVIGVLVLVAAMLVMSRFMGPTEASAISGAVPDQPFAPSVRMPR